MTIRRSWSARWSWPGDSVLMCRRAIEPRRGFWTLPAGYLEHGETLEEGAAREAWEEAQAEIAIDGILGVFSISRIGQVQVIFRARFAASGAARFAAGAESLEVALFPPSLHSARRNCLSLRHLGARCLAKDRIGSAGRARRQSGARSARDQTPDAVSGRSEPMMRAFWGCLVAVRHRGGRPVTRRCRCRRSPRRILRPRSRRRCPTATCRRRSDGDAALHASQLAGLPHPALSTKAWAMPLARTSRPAKRSVPIQTPGLTCEGAAAIAQRMIQIKSAAKAVGYTRRQTPVTGETADGSQGPPGASRHDGALRHTAGGGRPSGDAAWRASDRPARDRHPVGQLLLRRGDAVRAGQSRRDRRAHPRRGDRGGRPGGDGVPRLPAPQRHRGRMAPGRRRTPRDGGACTPATRTWLWSASPTGTSRRTPMRSP